MTVLMLLVVLAVVGVVYVTRHHAHQVATPSGVAFQHTEPISRVGWASLIVLVVAFAVYALTFATLPIYFTAVLAGAAFVLALVAVVARHDRSPILLVPLLFVPLATGFRVAFVLLG